MDHGSIVTSFFIIFSGAAVLASVALFTRQPLILAYIAIGAIAGPYGLHWVSDAAQVGEVAEIGIIFLLFLLGLDMQPSALLNMLRKATLVALLTSLAFCGAGWALARAFGFTVMEAWVIGIAMMFSSTIIGIKLLPTTVLHHKHTGELVVGLLLLQDLIAIIALLVLEGAANSSADLTSLLKTFAMLPALVAGAMLLVRYVVLPLIARFDRFHEYIFLVAIGWCLGVATVAHQMGLSLEIGGFVAGVSLATSPIAQYMAEHLKPLRDFFLVLFFFSLGATFNMGLLSEIWVPSLVLALTMLALKPVAFWATLRLGKEPSTMGWEIGFRLGQISEFSLLIAFLATRTGQIGHEASHVIQATAILTFVLNCYLVVFNYPTPIAVSDRLRRD